MRLEFPIDLGPVIRRSLERTSPALAVVAEVLEERARQDAKWGGQNHSDGTGGTALAHQADVARLVTNVHAAEGRLTWHDVLAEEVAEAFVEQNPAKLRAELIQVAAVAVQWVQAIDRRTDTTDGGGIW